MKGSPETGLPRTPVPTGDPQIGAGERTGPAMANAVAVSGRLPQGLHPPFPLGERKGTF